MKKLITLVSIIACLSVPLQISATDWGFDYSKPQRELEAFGIPLVDQGWSSVQVFPLIGFALSDNVTDLELNLLIGLRPLSQGGTQFPDLSSFKFRLFVNQDFESCSVQPSGVRNLRGRMLDWEFRSSDQNVRVTRVASNQRWSFDGQGELETAQLWRFTVRIPDSLRKSDFPKAGLSLTVFSAVPGEPQRPTQVFLPLVIQHGAKITTHASVYLWGYGPKPSLSSLVEDSDLTGTIGLTGKVLEGEPAFPVPVIKSSKPFGHPDPKFARIVKIQWNPPQMWRPARISVKESSDLVRWDLVPNFTLIGEVGVPGIQVLTSDSEAKFFRVEWSD